MSASAARRCRSACSDRGTATTTEYILLTGISVLIFLALYAATGTFHATARDDGTAIAAQRIAETVSETACDAAGSGDVSASVTMNLPGLVCGMPYLAFPAQDGRSIVISVLSGTTGHMYSVPLPLRAGGVRIAGFIASPPAEHQVSYDAAARTVTLS